MRLPALKGQGQNEDRLYSTGHKFYSVGGSNPEPDGCVGDRITSSLIVDLADPLANP